MCKTNFIFTNDVIWMRFNIRGVLLKFWKIATCLQSLLSFAQTCFYILIWTVETLSLGNVVQIGKVAIHFLAKLLWYIGMLNPGQKGSQLGNIGGSCENYCFSCDFSSVSRAVQSHYPAQQIPLSHGLIVAFSTKINSEEINGFLVLTLFNTKSTTFFSPASFLLQFSAAAGPGADNFV